MHSLKVDACFTSPKPKKVYKDLKKRNNQIRYYVKDKEKIIFYKN